MSTRLKAILVAALVTVAGADGAQAADDRIIVKDGRVAQIGAYDTATGIPGAIKVFGEPSSKTRRDRGVTCMMRWNRFRLLIVFRNLGVGRLACDAGEADEFSATGRKFRTWRGARVGMSVRALLARHKRARRATGGDRNRWRGWVLRMGPNIEGGSMAVVTAVTRRGRVRSIDGYIGLAGI